ncbi:hypothetical protein MIR68_001144 [Amoeboaphelidium protococcarum]|nr:hypothetical protein MIR68_001144 [Amoeboaphelidium protococcarum]
MTTLHYTFVFCVLIFEMTLTALISLPMPVLWRKRLFEFCAKSTALAWLHYYLKIAFVFIFVLFLDSLRLAVGKDQSTNQFTPQNTVNEAQMYMKLFRAQRNMYLTGFTLFMSLLLNRTFAMIGEAVKYQTQIEALKKHIGEDAAQEITDKADQKVHMGPPQKRVSPHLKAADSGEQVEQLQKELKHAQRHDLNKRGNRAAGADKLQAVMGSSPDEGKKKL